MSPASSGALEVERYIGACLISSQQSRHKKHYVNSNHQDVLYQQNFVDYRLQRCNSGERWAGGMPLISFSNHQRCWNNNNHHHQHEQQGTPLSRLAVHTQGVPLILSNNKYRKNKGRNAPSAKPEVKKQEVCTDAVSVASDESSGSGNSDNCLPRIIKPRKRRKKDRKPPHLLRPITGSQEDQFSTESPSPDIDFTPINSSPVTPFPYNPYKYDQISNNQTPGDISETPKLHHSFEDIEELTTDLNGNVEETLCQCRYCDPSGQIWDIDRSCYSPFLTTPPFQFPETPRRYTRSPIPDTFIDTLSSFSLDDPKDPLKSRKNLEVSTEIVTSLNGHRDLEIKFFSSSCAVDHKSLFDSNSEGDLKRLFSTSSNSSDCDLKRSNSSEDYKNDPETFFTSSSYSDDHFIPTNYSEEHKKPNSDDPFKIRKTPFGTSNRSGLNSDGDFKRLLSSSSSSSSVSNSSDDNKSEQPDYLLINKCPQYAEPEE